LGLDTGNRKKKKWATVENVAFDKISSSATIQPVTFNNAMASSSIVEEDDTLLNDELQKEELVALSVSHHWSIAEIVMFSLNL
jgi:hypothetical protein